MPDVANTTGYYGFVLGLLSAARNSIRCLNMLVELKGNCAKAFEDSFFSFNWVAVGQIFSPATPLIVLRITLRSHEHVNAMWYVDQINTITKNFPGLPVTIGEGFYLGHTQFY